MPRFTLGLQASLLSSDVVKDAAQFPILKEQVTYLEASAWTI